jgi:hypothetical protein
MTTVKPKQLQPGMIVLSNVELYRGFTKNGCLAIEQPFLILDTMTDDYFSKDGIQITYLSSKGNVEKYTMTLNYNFVVL